MSITYNGNTSISSAIKFLDVYTGDQLRQIALDHIDLYGADNLSKLGTANTNWSYRFLQDPAIQSITWVHRSEWYIEKHRHAKDDRCY